MLTILVGNTKPEIKEDWCDVDQRMMPKELVKNFFHFHDESKYQTIRVYNDTAMNFIGQCIDEKSMSNNVVVYVGDDKFYYTDEGTLEMNWPWGLFNY